jgi:hypothetical protein
LTVDLERTVSRYKISRRGPASVVASHLALTSVVWK